VLLIQFVQSSYTYPLLQFGHGWDAGAMEYCDLMARGVLDPAKVTINAIDNSASVAGLVLTTECLVTEIPIELSEEDKQKLFDQQNMAAGMQA
jgi:chaperonin GroEL